MINVQSQSALRNNRTFWHLFIGLPTNYEKGERKLKTNETNKYTKIPPPTHTHFHLTNNFRSVPTLR